MLPAWVVNKTLSTRQRDTLDSVYEPRVIARDARTEADRVPASERKARWARFPASGVLPRSDTPAAAAASTPDVSEVNDRVRPVWIPALGNRVRLYGTYAAEYVRLGVDGLVYVSVRAIDPLADTPVFDYFEVPLKRLSFVPMVIARVEFEQGRIVVMQNDLGTCSSAYITVTDIAVWLAGSDAALKRRAKQCIFALKMARKCSNALDEQLRLSPDIQSLLVLPDDSSDDDMRPRYLLDEAAANNNADAPKTALAHNVKKFIIQTSGGGEGAKNAPKLIMQSQTLPSL
jgi:hypothetical protein